MKKVKYKKLDNGSRLCRGCKTENPRKARFCRGCGARFKKHRLWLWVFLSVVVSMGAACVIVWYVSLPTYLEVDGESYDKNITVSPLGVKSEFYVSTDAGGFSVYETEPWIKVDRGSYTAYVDLHFAANVSGSARTGEIVVSNGRQRVTIEVAQDAISDASAEIGAVRTEHGVYGHLNAYDAACDSLDMPKAGLRISVDFTIRGMNGKSGRLSVYAHENERSLEPGDDSGFYVPKREAVACSDFVPSYDASVYTDYDLFVPYDEFRWLTSSSDATVMFDVAVEAQMPDGTYRILAVDADNEFLYADIEQALPAE